MAENAVSLKIGTDLSQLEADSKKLGSALDGAARGGIAGFEAVQNRVIVLTKQLGELRTALLQTNDPARQAQLNAALSQTSAQLQAAKTQMRGMSMETREANEKAQMLAAQFGVRLPQGLGVLLARMPAVQTAMAAAFNFTIIGAFIAGIVTLGVKGWEALENLRGKTEELTGWLKKAADENMRLFLGFTTSEEGSKRIAELAKRSAEAEGKIAVLKKQLDDLDPAAAVAAMIISSRLNKAEAEARVITDQLNEALANQTKVLGTEHKNALAAAAKGAKELFEAEWRLDYLYEHRADALKKAQGVYDQYAVATAKDLEKLPPLITDQEFALKHLPPVIQDLQTAHELANEAMINDMKAQDEAAKKALAQQEQLAHGIESFIDRVFIQARSLSDVFHQFLMQLLASFVKWVSQMLASWLTGVRQLTAGAGGGGGLLGGLLGGLFGIGGGTQALAATGGGLGGGWATQVGQLGLPAGMGGMALTGGGGIPTAVGGAAQGGLGQLAFGGTSLANLATMAPLLAILGGVSLGGHGGPITGGIGGLAVGIGLTAALGALGPATFGLTWVAAGIGALIGAARRGRQKRKSAALEQQFEFSADDIEKQYELHKIDYESAVSSLEGLIASGQQTLLSAGTGRWGQQGSENLTRVIRDLIARVNDLEKQRQATTTTLAGMTIPEFAIGGAVGGWQSAVRSGGILAILHPGEFVMQQRAVDALGVNFLAALNRAPAFAAGGRVASSQLPVTSGRAINIENLNLYPERGMSDREAMEVVLRGFNLATREGAL